ncbi:DUF4402 domain-containing protein [Gillisia sp. JM1]|uniref:DUF4402 domain-containing protein n=1 Tax=Gillisia sp. JM1 TaxID=1283286 RepID=UPI0004103164|nr:DUF4402 domain-containing protein [Gillisia sp. JM1]
MKNLNSAFQRNLKLILNFGLVLFTFSSGLKSIAQENPPIPIEVKVRTARFLNFGKFTLGTTGGTVVVTPNSQRTQTGEIYLLNLGPTVSSAMYEVKANPGTIITISHDDFFMLSNGGDKIRLDNLTYSVPKTFITTASASSINEIEIGGTLHIGNILGNRAGAYNGTIVITFIQQ